MKPELSKLAQIQDVLSQVVKTSHAGQTYVYALIDCAQHPELGQASAKRWSGACVSLFSGSSEIDGLTPVIAPILEHAQPSPLLACALRLSPDIACLSIFCSDLTPEQLANHFKRFLYIQDTDGQPWMLAFWDPGVLASLVGGDPTQYEPGPIFDEQQRRAFLEPIVAWAYWRRDGTLATVTGTERATSFSEPIVATARQMEALARVNWIDELLNAVEAVSPEFRATHGSSRVYAFVRDQVRELEARGIRDFSQQLPVLIEAVDEFGDAKPKAFP